MSRIWFRCRGPLREALLPFLLARVVVLGTLGLAHFIVDRTHPSTPGVAARVHAGLLGWDAGWFESIAREGYGPLGHQSLRFFPLVPLMTHAVAWLPGVGDGAALILVSNVAALVATALLFVLVRRETADTDLARRSIWYLSLAHQRINSTAMTRATSTPIGRVSAAPKPSSPAKAKFGRSSPRRNARKQPRNRQSSTDSA